MIFLAVGKVKVGICTLLGGHISLNVFPFNGTLLYLPCNKRFQADEKKKEEMFVRLRFPASLGRIFSLRFFGSSFI